MIGLTVVKVDAVRPGVVKVVKVKVKVVRPEVVKVKAVRPGVVKAVRPEVGKVKAVRPEVGQVKAADVIRVAEDVHAMVVEEEVHEGVIKSQSPIVSSGKKKPSPSAMRCKRVMSR
jgi:hypothetical protein